MKKLTLSLLTAASLAFTSPAYASGFPVFDGANLVEAVIDGISQGEQLIQLHNQYQTAVMEFNNLVAQARALGDIDALLDLNGLTSDLINTQEARIIFSEIHGIDPTRPNYEDRARTVLEDTYGIPYNLNTAVGDSIMALPPAQRNSAQEQVDRVNTRIATSVSASQAFADTRARQSDLLRASVAQQETLKTLGDESLVQTLQLQSAQGHTSIQMDSVQADYLSILAQEAQKRELEEIRNETLRVQSQARRNDRTRQSNNAPVTTVDLDAWKF